MPALADTSSPLPDRGGLCSAACPAVMEDAHCIQGDPQCGCGNDGDYSCDNDGLCESCQPFASVAVCL